MQATLLYVGAGVIFLWGLGHLVATRGVVSGFGPISPDNRQVVTMEWIAEGLTLCFLGVLVGIFALVVGCDHVGTHLAARTSAVMLLILAILSTFTGARTAVLPMKLCPFVKSAAAAAYLAATFL